MDCERAARLAPFLPSIVSQAGSSGALVFVKGRDTPENKKAWAKEESAEDWDTVMTSEKYAKIAAGRSWEKEPEAKLGDDGSIFFTSGTSGFVGYSFYASEALIPRFPELDYPRVSWAPKCAHWLLHSRILCPSFVLLSEEEKISRLC
jgi:hypothetical protein